MSTSLGGSRSRKNAKGRAGHQRQDASDLPPRTEVLFDEFFADVDAVRAHLDRNLHDPQRQRARLGRLVRDLLRPRGPRALAWWLGSQVQEALGSEACSVWIQDGTWGAWYRVGMPGAQLPPELLEGMGRGEAVRSPAGLAIPIAGMSGTIGVLWIGGAGDVDAGTRELLEAIAGTAGVVLEQALGGASLARAPATGSLAETALVYRLGLELRVAPPQGRCNVVYALRVELDGRDPGEAPAALGRATREHLAPGSPIGIPTPSPPPARSAEAGGSAELVASPPPLFAASWREEVRSLVDAIAAGCSAARWWCAAFATEVPVDDAGAVVEQLRAALAEAEEGRICALDPP